MRINRGRGIDLCSDLYYNIEMEKVKLLSVEQATKVLGISRSTTYGYLNSGELKAIKLDARTMIKLADLRNFIESREKYVGCINEV